MGKNDQKETISEIEVYKNTKAYQKPVGTRSKIKYHTTPSGVVVVSG